MPKTPLIEAISNPNSPPPKRQRQSSNDAGYRYRSRNNGLKRNAMENHRTDCRKRANGVHIVDLIHVANFNWRYTREDNGCRLRQCLRRREASTHSFGGKFKKRDPVRCCDDHRLLKMTVGGAARCSAVAAKADGLFGQSEWHLDKCSCDHLAFERNKPRRRQTTGRWCDQ